MNRIESRRWCRLLTGLLWLGMIMSPAALWAAEGEKPLAEPIWVMSWAMFVFFIAATVFFYTHSLTRAETLLNHEERKQIEEEAAARAASQKKAQLRAATAAQNKQRGPRGQH